MRKLNKWFFLTAVLALSLFAFSFIAYKKTRQVCGITDDCGQPSSRPVEKGDMLIDAVSRQFTSFVSIP